MSAIRILLADDHSVVIEGLRRILDHPEYEIAGAVHDGRALVEAAASLKPDIIIVDVRMPVLNGIEAVRRIRQTDRDVKIVFLSMRPEAVYAVEAMAAGASAYVLKSSAGEELISAISAVRAGGTFITASIADAVYQDLDSRTRNRSKIDGLTTRQREVLRFLAEGRHAKEVAEILHISPRTVEFHKYRIMEALGARTVAELARYAASHGIVD